VPKRLRLRPLTGEEEVALDRLARARTAPARAVERARIAWLAHRGWRGPALAREVGVSEQTVRRWLKRFHEGGLAGLGDAPRTGRPPTDAPEEVGAVVAISLTKPDDLGLPFGSWTLDRLAAYLTRSAASPSSAAGSRRSWWPKACVGASRRGGSASGPTRPLPKKGGDHRTLHGAACG
jgi:transposase